MQKLLFAMNEWGDEISALLRQSYGTGLMLENSSHELLENVNILKSKFKFCCCFRRDCSS